MKLIRYGEINKEKTGVVLDDKYYDTSAFGEDYNEAFFENDGLNRLKAFSQLTRICSKCNVERPITDFYISQILIC